MRTAQDSIKGSVRDSVSGSLRIASRIFDRPNFNRFLEHEAVLLF
jgi:hypothetical protein